MSQGMTADATRDQDQAEAMPAPPAATPVAAAASEQSSLSVSVPMGATLDSFLHTILEQRLPEETGEFLERLLGATMPKTADGSRYGILSAGRFHGSNTLDMLAHAQKKKMSGALVMVERDAERVLYLSEGALVGAASSVLFESLGRLLYQAEIVTHEDSSTLVDAEEKQGAHSLLLWISSNHLSWAVERRVWEVASAVHLIKRGHFVFIEGEPTLDCPPLSLDPTEVAEEGLRRHEALRHGTADDDVIYHPASMGPVPAKIDRQLNPIGIGDDTLREILKRIREAEETSA